MIFSTMTVKENIETGLVVSGGSEVPGDIYELFPVLLEMKGRRGGNSPADNSSSSRSRVRSPPSRRCCCSTS